MIILFCFFLTFAFFRWTFVFERFLLLGYIFFLGEFEFFKLKIFLFTQIFHILLFFQIFCNIKILIIFPYLHPSSIYILCEILCIVPIFTFCLNSFLSKLINFFIIEIFIMTFYPLNFMTWFLQSNYFCPLIFIDFRLP